MDRCLREHQGSTAIVFEAQAERTVSSSSYFSSLPPIPIWLFSYILSHPWKVLMRRLFLLFILSVISVSTNADSTPQSFDKKTLPSAQEANSKILIAQAGEGVSALWCGSSDTLIVSSKTLGVRWFDLLSNKKIVVQPGSDDYPMGCTPDGRWVLHVDRKSSRYDINYVPKEDSGWDGGVIDLYRFDTVTGVRQKFAVIQDGGPYTVMAPTAFRVLLGAKHNSSVKMPEPIWDVLWFTNDWGAMGARWFRDSSGIVKVGTGDRVYVEFFGKNGWSKVFETKLGVLSGIRVDSANRIYFFAEPEAASSIKNRTLYRCKISDNALSCSDVLKRRGYFTSYAVLPSGDILLTKKGDSCIRRIAQNSGSGKCLVEEKGYDVLYINDISHDGSRLLYTRGFLKKLPSGAYQVAHNDILVTKLATE